MKNQLKSRNAFIVATVTTTIAATVLTPVGVYASFTDVGASYKAAVQFLSTKGVQGFSSKQFGVAQPIKRVDAAVMLAKVLHLSTHDAPDSGFTDVPERAVDYINVLKAEGVVNGVSPKKFNANSYITRGEIAIMIQKAYGLPGDANHKFRDVSSTFKQAVGALYNFNVTKGISSKLFGTNQPVTRGDFANMLHRASKIDPSKIPGGAANLSVFSITKATYISSTEVELTFSKAVDSVKKGNFSIDGLTVKKVKLAEDKKRVTLTVENMNYETNYTIKARDIKINKVVQRDVTASFRSGSMPDDVKIEDVAYVSITELEVYLSRAVDKVNAKNFTIEGLTVKKATLSKDKKRVNLIVDNMEYSENYTIKARDIEINKIVQKDVTASFRSESIPSDLKIRDVHYVSITELEVELSRTVDSVNAKNFTIEGLTVKKATLSTDKKQVTLIVDHMEYDKRYTLKTNEIKINKILQKDVSVSFRSEDMPDDLEIEDVTYVSITELEVEFSEAVDSVNAKNFIIEDLTVKKATLSQNKKRVTLLVDKMEYDERYRLTARNLSINKEVQQEITTSFRSRLMPANVKLVDADYLSKTEIKVTFSKAVDRVKVDNFMIDGITVTKAQLSDDNKTATLTVKDMIYNKRYTVRATDIQQNKIVQADSSVSFRSEAAPASLYMTNIKYITRSQIEVTFSKAVDSIKAANFSIDDIEVSGAKLSKDKMSAILTLKTLEYGKQYTLNMKDVEVDGDLQANSSRTFKSEISVGDLAITETKYLSQTEIELTFNKAIDGAKETNFFIIQRGGISSAKSPNVAKVKLSKDKKTVTLTVENLGYGKTYEVQAVDLQVNKVTQAASKGTFTSADLEDVWDVLITTKKPKVLEDKKTQTEVTFQIMNKQTRKVDSKATDIVLNVGTNYGEFEVDGLSLPEPPNANAPSGLSTYKMTTKSGKTTLTLITPASEREVTATITATVTEDVPTTHSYLPGRTGTLDVLVKETIPLSTFQIANVRGHLNGSGEDTIEITFTEGVHTNEGKNDATDPSRYTVNGQKLDKDTAMVTVACKRDEDDETDGNCDENDASGTDVKKGYNAVIIILPDKTLRGDYNNLVSVDSKLLSYSYTFISGNLSRAFWGENNVPNDSLDVSGTSSGDIVIQQEENTASMGPEDGIRTVLGNVKIQDSDAIGSDGKLYLDNLTINGDLEITSSVEEIHLAASVKVKGDIVINNETMKKVFSRGEVQTIDVMSTGTNPIDIRSQDNGVIPKVRINTTQLINLYGLVTEVEVKKPTTVEAEKTVEKVIVDLDPDFNNDRKVMLKGMYNNIEIVDAVTLEVDQLVDDVVINTLGPVRLEGSNTYNKVNVEQVPSLLEITVTIGELNTDELVEVKIEEGGEIEKYPEDLVNDIREDSENI